MSNNERDEQTDAADAGEDAAIDPYDLDEDGKVSVVEAERGRLGIVDARMEELAEEPGIKGKLAEAAHKVLDKLDND